MFSSIQASGATSEGKVRTHTVGDDLESLFWVLLYCDIQKNSETKLPWFAKKCPDIPKMLKDMFRPSDIDHHESGKQKKGYLKYAGNDIVDIEYTSDTLQDLMSRCREAWKAVYVGNGSKDEVTKIRTPSFWIDLFASLLGPLAASSDISPVSQVVHGASNGMSYNQ
jgi:hypothetical protein